MALFFIGLVIAAIVAYLYLRNRKSLPAPSTIVDDATKLADEAKADIESKL